RRVCCRVRDHGGSKTQEPQFCRSSLGYRRCRHGVADAVRSCSCKSGHTDLIHGVAGKVGAYAVQMARNAGLEALATASSKDLEYERGLGAHWSSRCPAPSSSGSEVTSTTGKALLHLRFRKLPMPLAIDVERALHPRKETSERGD